MSGQHVFNEKQVQLSSVLAGARVEVGGQRRRRIYTFYVSRATCLSFFHCKILLQQVLTRTDTTDWSPLSLCLSNSPGSEVRIGGGRESFFFFTDFGGDQEIR